MPTSPTIPPAPAGRPPQVPVEAAADIPSITDRTGATVQPVATNHLLTGLRTRTISSGIVTGLSQGVQFCVNLASIVVLARVLTPDDFGLVAMVATIMGFLRIFNEAGLSTATIQREGITQAQVSNLFWTNLALGGIVTVLLAVSSPAIAWFYREPRLVTITLALSVTFILTSSTVQHIAVLKRQMRFGVVAAVQTGAAVIGVAVGVGMAWFDFGYWSLVAMNLVTAVAGCVLTWAASSWRPGLPVRRSGTRSLLAFGANLTVSSFLWSLVRGSDALLIGRIFGPASLGLYSRAQALLLRPVEQFISPLETVVVPTLSRLQNQPERYRAMVFQVFDVVALVSFAFGGLLFSLAHPLTLVVLGSQWEQAAPIFAGFTLVALYAPITNVAGWLITSQGRGRDFLVLTSTACASTLVAFGTGLLFGPAGVAVAYSISCLVVQLPVAYYIAGRAGPVRAGELWHRFFTHLPVWAVVAGASWLTRIALPVADPVHQLLLGVPAGLLAGAAFVWSYTPARRVLLNVFESLVTWQKSRGAVLANQPACASVVP